MALPHNIKEGSTTTLPPLPKNQVPFSKRQSSDRKNSVRSRNSGYNNTTSQKTINNVPKFPNNNTTERAEQILQRRRQDGRTNNTIRRIIKDMGRFTYKNSTYKHLPSKTSNSTNTIYNRLSPRNSKTYVNMTNKPPQESIYENMTNAIKPPEGYVSPTALEKVINTSVHL